MVEFPIDTCPVEDCERGPFDTEGSLRGHVNASGADGHDWAEVKEQLEAGDSEGDDQEEQADQGDTTSDEAGKGGDGSATDDQETEGDDQPKAGEKQGDEQATERDEGDMPTQDEYEQQHDTSDGQAKAGDGDSDGGTSNQGQTTSGSPLAALPMDPLTLGMLLAVAVGLYLTYRALSDSGGSDQPTTSGGQGESGDGSTTDDQPEQGEISGGLAG